MSEPNTDAAPPLEHKSTLDDILHHSAVAAVLLLLSAVAAFVMANMALEVAGVPVSQWYSDLWHVNFGFALHGMTLEKPLHLWINDGLMAIFFFVVGLEIKRELLVGELSSLRKATLPFVAAAGGMVFPALIFAALNLGAPGAKGWGIPMATDIAFAAGILGLFRSRVPNSLAVFLLALAIVDDLGAVLVIAIFYTDSIAQMPLFVGLGVVVFSAVIAAFGIRSSLIYALLFAVVWVAFLSSGVRATIAGVLFAFTVPVKATYDTPLFASRLRTLLRRFEAAEDHEHPRLVNARQQQLVRAIETECVHVEAPLQRLEDKLHAPVSLLIMPIFAFANSGVAVDFSQLGEIVFSRVTLGVFFGLLLGKQLGIMLACWIAVKLGLAELPSGVRWKQLYAVCWLAGIGFTMSLFIAELAFAWHGYGESSLEIPLELAEAKIGILIASITAGIIGAVLLLMSSPKLPPDSNDGNAKT